RVFSRLSKVSQPSQVATGRKTPWSAILPKFPIIMGLGLGLGLSLTGCQDPKPRTYSEIAFKPNPVPGGMGGPMMGGGQMGAGAGMMPPMMNASPVDIKVAWKLPE